MTLIGRKRVHRPEHPRARAGYIDIALDKAEKALGKYINGKHPIHHFDLNSHNDLNNNLVVCESRSYHKLLHRRTEALKICGHANWLKCNYCKQYDEPKNIRVYKNGAQHHIFCERDYQRKRKG